MLNLFFHILLSMRVETKQKSSGLILGVEFAAELKDFVKHDLVRLYPELHDKISITLIDGFNKILSTYDEEVGCIFPI